MERPVLPRRLLLGPGPSNVHPRVRAALAQPMIGHLDPAFLEVLDEVQAALRRLFGTRNAMTLPISATGSAGMEACFVNLLEPGDEALVCVNGVFGGRMCDNVERCGAKLTRVERDLHKRIVEVQRDAGTSRERGDVLAGHLTQMREATTLLRDEIKRLGAKHDVPTPY